MKPISYWLNTIKDPEIRKRAIDNSNNYNSYSVFTCKDFLQAIQTAFLWEETNEGTNFWKTFAATPTKSFDELKHLLK